MMYNLLSLRAADARAKSAFYAGETDVHPHGLSGRRTLLPAELTSRTWDVAPHAKEFSEWGEDCGWDHDPWVSRKMSRIKRTKDALASIVCRLEKLREQDEHRTRTGDRHPRRAGRVDGHEAAVRERAVTDDAGLYPGFPGYTWEEIEIHQLLVAHGLEPTREVVADLYELQRANIDDKVREVVRYAAGAD